jgi:signal transduction histidine kinase
LQEVLINLVRNAVEAMSAVRDGHRILQVGTDCHDNKAIVISVRDSGPGIDPLVLDRLFEVFVTTKPDGMGLGLALCRMIVERQKPLQHKGLSLARTMRTVRTVSPRHLLAHW